MRLRGRLRGVWRILLVGVRSVGEFVLGGTFCRVGVERGVVEILDGVVMPVSGPFRERFKHWN